jgi:hypothetical protein
VSHHLLDAVHGALTRYVVFPTPAAADALTLWIAATHAQPAWEHASRFVVKSPIKRCGKTRLQEVTRELVHRPLATTNISVAALVRSLDEDDPPTLILDEADAIFGAGKDRPESAEDLRGILNSGHSRGWPYLRWDQQRRQLEACATFAMALVGGIGSMPDTLEDRAVVVSMRRRAPGETVAPFRRRRAVPPLHELRDELHGWVVGLRDELADAEPDLPVEDRAADVWEPLVAIADAAGGDWPARARTACTTLTEDTTTPDDGTAGERLLADLHGVFGDAEALWTTTILEQLHGLEEAPWGDWYGRELTARDLARLLRPWGVSSRNVRTAEGQAKGYHRADLIDPWSRYTHAAVPAVPPSHEGLETAPDLREPAGTDAGTDAATTSVPPSDLRKHAVWDAGTDGTDERVDHATAADPWEPCPSCGRRKFGTGLCRDCEVAA